MDLLSLPKEMLASVLKYNSYNKRVQLRKINRHIDSVTKAYILTQLPVTELEIYENLEKPSTEEKTELRILIEEKPLQLCEGKVEYVFNYREEFENNVSVVTALDSTFRKGIILHCGLTLLVKHFDDDIIDVLCRNRKSLRYTESLTIYSTITCSSNKLEKLFECLHKLHTLEVKQSNIIGFFNSKLLKNKKWRSLIICDKDDKFFGSEHNHNGLDDQFLKEVVPNCGYLKISCFCNTPLQFTIPVIINTFKATFGRGIYAKWSFHSISRKNLSLDEVERLCNQIPNCNTKIKIQNGIHIFAVTSTRSHSALRINVVE